MTARAGGSTAAARGEARWPAILLVITLAATAVVRWRWLDVPLERDEGEYAYAGQLILAGEPPYRLAYNMKFPGTYLAYAVVLGSFGQTSRGVHLGLLVVNLATIALVFRLAKTTIGDVAAVSSAAAYAILSVGPATLGTAAHATHFIVAPALAGLLLLRRGLLGGRLWLMGAGACFGVAIMAKQPGAFFLAFGLVYAMARPTGSGSPRAERVANAACVAGGAAVPLLATGAWLSASGVFGRFWFWTIRYAGAYVGEMSIADGWERFHLRFGDLLKEQPVLWALAAAGLVLLAVEWRRNEQASFFVGLSVFSFLAVCPGLYFRPHYFVPLLPAVALLGGVASARLSTWLAARAPAPARAAIPAVVVGLTVLASVWNRAEFSPALDPARIALGRYRGNPFAEAPLIARYIRERTQPGDRIAVVGSEPEIYFYAHRRSATGYIYTYALMENQPFAEEMRREMIHEIEAARPEYIVVVTNKYSWLKHPGSSTAIFDWIKEFLNAHYEATLVLEKAGTPEVHAYWDPQTEYQHDVGPECVFVARRVR